MTLPIILILDHLRSAFNVGSIIRLSACLDISEVWFCGYTPTPVHPKIKSTAMQTQEFIAWQHFENTTDAVSKAKEMGFTVYAVENHTSATSIYDTIFSDQIALVMGNEALGVSADVLDVCDQMICIPIPGWKTTLNVGMACGVVCFEIYRRTQCPNCPK